MTELEREGSLPLFPLELVLFPGARVRLHIFEDRYKQMIGECLAESAPFGIVLSEQEEVGDVGCAAAVVAVLHRYPDGRLDILAEGTRRFRLLSTDSQMPYLRGAIEWLEDEAEPDPAAERRSFLDLYRRTFWAHGLGGATPSQVEASLPTSWTVAGSSFLDLGARQRLLASTSERRRLEMLFERLTALEPLLRKVAGNGHGRHP